MSGSQPREDKPKASVKRSTAKKTCFHSPYLTTSDSNPAELFVACLHLPRPRLLTDNRWRSVNEFWQHATNVAELEDDFKQQALPLARIKKVMKSDFEVKMISSEVTILFEKASQSRSSLRPLVAVPITLLLTRQMSNSFHPGINLEGAFHLASCETSYNH